jgi:hypothetical protein
MKVILTCTTTYERQSFFYYGLQSLINQSLKPDLFLINISDEPYLADSGFTDLPDWLENNKLTINRVKNTGPYRKLLPALDFAEEEDLIVTADDDVLYGKEWLETLIHHSHKNPEAIVCGRGRQMKRTLFNGWKNYPHWNNIREETRGAFILPIGVGGVVYRKPLLDLGFLNDPSFLAIAPSTDDLWYKIASLLKNTPVCVFPALDTNNYTISHHLGLQEDNRKNGYIDFSHFSKLVNEVWIRIADRLGINRVMNDAAWDSILKYAASEYGLDLDTTFGKGEKIDPDFSEISPRFSRG